MKVKSRIGVFETNSSSTHAMVLSSSTSDKNRSEIVSSIRAGKLIIPACDYFETGVYDTFMEKLSYLTLLRIQVNCEEGPGKIRYEMSVLDNQKLREWENNVIARLAAEGIHCEGFGYNELLSALNDDVWFRLDHQVIEGGEDDVGNTFECVEKRYVTSRNGWVVLAEKDDPDAKQDWIRLVKGIFPGKSDIDILFDDKLAIKYMWDSEIHYDGENGIDVDCNDAIAAAEESRKIFEEETNKNARGSNR